MESKPSSRNRLPTGSKEAHDSDFKHFSAEVKESISVDYRSSPIIRRNVSEDFKRSDSDRERKDSSDPADLEFERLKVTPAVITPEVASCQVAKNFVNGFKISSMNMCDAYTGREIWHSGVWDASTMFDDEIDERIPKEILSCRSVSRELVFSSTEEVKKFRLEQRIYFRGTCIEEWFFSFGYVIAGSSNSWQQTIDAAPPSQMLSAEVLSGNVVFETSFYDDKQFLCKNSVRIHYV